MSVGNLMDRDQLKLWILRTLGAPLVKVELTDDHLEDSITEAMRWFAAKKGVKMQGGMALTVGQTEYNLPDEVDTVMGVVFSANPWDLSLVFAPFILPEQQLPYSVFAASEAGGLYSNFTQTLQYIETAKRVLSAEPDWRQEGRKLYVFPAAKNSGTLVLEYKSTNVTLEQLNGIDHDLVKRYSLAAAMMRLGRIRSKYDSFPTAQGSTSLDGAALLDEARTMIETLDERIAQLGYPMGFMVG
jgi:hypothetical protein